MKFGSKIYYREFTDDLVESDGQNYQLPSDYEWIKKGAFKTFLYSFYYALFLPIAIFYSKFFLHASVKNKKLLKQANKTGAFVYANHTQPVGDAFIPAWLCYPRHMYVIISPANFGIPLLGKIIDYLGGLPVPQKLTDMSLFNDAIKKRVSEKRCVIVYPEAHVWPYYTEIRPFSAASFSYAIENDKPVYCFTNTYQKRKFGKKPKMTVYIDGPFYADKELSKKQQRAELHRQVFECMQNRSKASNYSFYEYIKTDEVEGEK